MQRRAGGSQTGTVVMSPTLLCSVLLNLEFRVRTCLSEVCVLKEKVKKQKADLWLRLHSEALGMRAEARRRSSMRLYSMSLCVSLPHTVHVR